LVLKGAPVVKRMFTVQKSTASNSFYRWLGRGYVNLASVKRTGHILFGDKTGGGHMWPGKPGKSIFPNHWKGGEIMHYISDIATDPSVHFVESSTKSGLIRYVGVGQREGVNIKVVLDASKNEIISGYPLW